jgi:hypothetical protein
MLKRGTRMIGQCSGLQPRSKLPTPVRNWTIFFIPDPFENSSYPSKYKLTTRNHMTMTYPLSRSKKRPIFDTCATPNIDVYNEITQRYRNLKSF